MQPFVFLQRQNRFDISWQHRWDFWVCCCAFPLRQWVILQECSYLWSGTSPASPPSSWRSGWFGRVCVTPDCRGHFGHRSCWGHGYWKLISSNHYLGESVGEKPNGQEHTETQPFIRKHPSLMTDFSLGRCSLSPLPPSEFPGTYFLQPFVQLNENTSLRWSVWPFLLPSCYHWYVSSSFL